MAQGLTPPLTGVTDKPNRKLKLLRIFLVIMLVLIVGSELVAYYRERRAITDLDKNGSAAYKGYVRSIQNLSGGLRDLEMGMKEKGS